MAQVDAALIKFQSSKPVTIGNRLIYSGGEIGTLTTAARAVVDRVVGSRSVYGIQVTRILEGGEPTPNQIALLSGVLFALRDDIASGYLDSLVETIHAEVFSDFLSQAAYLHSEGYKDPAAVVAGSVLENHLRQLAAKYAVDVEATNPRGDTMPKKADGLNADLVKANAYGKLDQKSVTAWLDLRNKAAHGNYNEYTADQVGLLIQGIRDFITRNPA